MNHMFGLNPQEIAILKKLNTPQKLQDYLNQLRANFEPEGDMCMSPRRVLREQRAHCIEGALLAATVLWYHGEKPLLMDLRSTPKDFDHVVTLFKRHGHWGALSKTNHAVLRYREPIYKTPRELALSYFHEYFLDTGVKTLRDYSKPFDVSKYGTDWITGEDDQWDIVTALDESPHTPIISREMIRTLRKADEVEIQAGKIVQWQKSKK